MENETYKIGRISYSQGELTWGQDKALVKLYNSVSNSGFKSAELRLKDLQPLLTKYGLLDKFFGIILKPKFNLVYLLSFKWITYFSQGKIELDAASNSQIGQIFSDFFLLNKKFVNKLTEYMSTLGLIATETEKMRLVKKAE